jgi:hypothetical protein
MKEASIPAEFSPQTRRSKVEARKKPGTRRSNPAACSRPAAHADRKRFGLCAFSPETTAASAQAAACSGLRASAFFRPSAFGFRISRATRLPTETARGEKYP